MLKLARKNHVVAKTVHEVTTNKPKLATLLVNFTLFAV
jgi:hypothetical protein